MKLSMILSVMATALVTTATIAPAATAMLGLPSHTATVRAQETADATVQSAVTGGNDAHWLRLVSNDKDDRDDDDREGDDDNERGDDDGEGDDDDDNCNGDKNCNGANSSMPKGPMTPPSNGLFSTGKAPQVKSN